VVYRDRVRYAVVGDVGPGHTIGEASYAAAEELGIDPDPRVGGTASGVTYIVFKDSQASPVESHAAAVAAGERLARKWLDTAAEAVSDPPAHGSAHGPVPTGRQSPDQPSSTGGTTPLLTASEARRTAAACSPVSAGLPVPAKCGPSAAGP
jgi:hypothetical protein